mgnify:CR=1 FL=1
MIGKKLTEYCYWTGKIADIVVREKSWNILLNKRTFNGNIQKIYINFQNNVSKQYFQIGDIVEINGIIQIDFDKQTSCRWGNNIKIVWTERQTHYQPRPQIEPEQPQQEPKKEIDFEFESMLQELDNEVKKL